MSLHIALVHSSLLDIMNRSWFLKKKKSILLLICKEPYCRSLLLYKPELSLHCISWDGTAGSRNKNDYNWYLNSAYFVPNIALSGLYLPSHSIFTITLWGFCCYLCFTAGSLSNFTRHCTVPSKIITSIHTSTISVWVSTSLPTLVVKVFNFSYPNRKY